MSEQRPASPRERALVVLSFVVALALGLLAARGMSYWEDDLGTLNEAKRIDSVGAFLTAPRYDWHPPLAFLFTKVWLGVSGLKGLPGEELPLRLPFLFCGALAAPLAWALGRRTGLQAPAAVGVAFATAASPLLLWVDRDIRGYALLVPLVGASHLFLLRALDGGARRDWATWAVLAALAMGTHYVAIPIGAAQGLFALVHARSRKAPLLAGVLAVALFLPWLPALKTHLTTLELGKHAAEVQLNVPPVALTSPAYVMFGLVLGHTTFPWRFAVVIPVALAAAWLVRPAVTRARKDAGPRHALLFGIALPVLLAVVTTMRMPRYHCTAVVPLLIALAHGAEHVAAVHRPFALALVAALGLGVARSDANLFLGREHHFLYPLRPFPAIAAKLAGRRVIWDGPGADVAAHYGVDILQNGRTRTSVCASGRDPGASGPRAWIALEDPDAEERATWTLRPASHAPIWAEIGPP